MTADLTQDHRRQSLYALAADVFGAGVRVACVEIAGAEVAGLLGAEVAAVAKAIPARQKEFTAGRLAARAAMGRDLAILMAADRSPVWPEGVAGSISHAGGWALAVVAGAGALIGVDLEVDESLPDEVFDTVLTPAERVWIAMQPNTGHWARVIFSAKECAYKAQYARSGLLFGFEMFEVILDVPNGGFSATFQAGATPFQKGDRLTGRFARQHGFVLTGLVG